MTIYLLLYLVIRFFNRQLLLSSSYLDSSIVHKPDISTKNQFVTSLFEWNCQYRIFWHLQRSVKINFNSSEFCMIRKKYRSTSTWTKFIKHTKKVFDFFFIKYQKKIVSSEFITGILNMNFFQFIRFMN